MRVRKRRISEVDEPEEAGDERLAKRGDREEQNEKTEKEMAEAMKEIESEEDGPNNGTLGA